MNITETTAPSWRAKLEGVQSLGQTTEKATSLGGLHEARRTHKGQFFTPRWVAKLMWDIAHSQVTQPPRYWVNVLDNSVGTGRLLEFADPKMHYLAGMDVHEDVVNGLNQCAADAGIRAEFLNSGMERVHPKGFHLAVINPPFSLRLNDAAMRAYPCTTHGKLGPNTSAQSDEYALAQALDAACVVVALLPATLADRVVSDGYSIIGDDVQRLRAVVDLPASAFSGEGAEARTKILAFDGRRSVNALDELQYFSTKEGDASPEIDVAWVNYDLSAKLHQSSVSSGNKVITTAVTGDNSVGLSHDGRRIRLKFKCGFTEARVLNAVMRERIFSSEVHRLPRGVKYAGQGALDIQNILAADEPMKAFGALLESIKEAGAKPVVSTTLWNRLQKLIRAKPRYITPSGHWVFKQGFGQEVTAVARKAVALDPKSWASPVIARGKEARLQRVGEKWRVAQGGKALDLTQDEAQALFEMPAMQEGWEEVHKPLQAIFPEVAKTWYAKARRMGLDKTLSWDFQFEDLIECMIRPRGDIMGWEQGLGKARLSAAIILLRGVKHGLVAMPAYLLDEYQKRLVAIDLPREMWSVIDSPQAATDLKKINIISYERLRRGIKEGAGKTYAALLRGRIGAMICDEGEILANSDSDQSRAIAQVRPKNLYITTGTPAPNYPRNVLPIATAVHGDATVAQPYGIKRHKLEKWCATSMAHASRGVDAFAKDFVSTVWCTNQFAEELNEGAKREVPKIANVDAYRRWVAPLIKRRLKAEPQVRAQVKIKDPIKRVHEIPWQEAHLAYYLKVCDEFHQIYKKSKEQKKNNLMMLLVRIGAVIQAANNPSHAYGKQELTWRGQMTSKQLWSVNRLYEAHRDGVKAVYFAQSPKSLRVIERGLREFGVEPVMFHGEIDKKKRNRDLDLHWREGSSNILLTTFGVMQAGWDLYQGSLGIIGERDWSARTESQAYSRMLRPQQTKDVAVEYPHLAGSIDIYMAQTVAWKENAARVGLDWAAPEHDDDDFLHMDTIIGRFVEDLAKMRGMKHHQFREMMKEGV